LNNSFQVKKILLKQIRKAAYFIMRKSINRYRPFSRQPQSAPFAVQQTPAEGLLY